MGLKVFAALGGGIGDVSWDWLHEPTFRKIPSLVRDYGARVRLITQCSCPGTTEIFKNCPYVHEVVEEPWHPPTQADAVRWHNPTPDGYIPLQRNDLLAQAGVNAINLESPRLFLSAAEQQQVIRLTDRRPCIVAQPYAGLSDRDGFDTDAIARLAGSLDELNPGAVLLVIGKNHDRGHKYAKELCPQGLPNVVDLIDRLDFRVSYHLVEACDAYVGCHSNFIRTAWDFRKRTALVVPDPLMTRHLPTLDPKYTYGMRYPENRTFTFPFDHGGEREFDKLDTASIARFLLGTGDA